MQENNVLLAMFLGWVEQKDPTERWFGSFRDLNGTVHKNTNKEPLLFHTDWNWLMLVVTQAYETIELIDDKKEGDWDFQIKQIQNAFSFPEIGAVYIACVKFVEWYNENK